MMMTFWDVKILKREWKIPLIPLDKMQAKKVLMSTWLNMKKKNNNQL